ncbi:MAG: hypothetical protein ACYTF9_05505 [Planctomycetota bacterium]|jgi:hypothetical protein
MSTILSTLLATPLLLGTTTAQADFEAPVQITTAGQAFSDVLFPTPVLQDIDGDDDRELVVGDLIGNIWISKATNSETGWGERDQLESGGKALRLNNW